MTTSGQILSDVPFQFGCEDGCEHYGAEWVGTSIYGPDEISWCSHPANKSGSCKHCPRRSMNASELITDLFESVADQGDLISSIDSALSNIEDYQRARASGRPYEPDMFKDPDEVVAEVRRLINEHRRPAVEVQEVD